MIRVHAPGKIMLTGEWAILEPGNTCIALPTQKHLVATLTPSDRYTIYAPELLKNPITLLRDATTLSIHPAHSEYEQKLLHPSLIAAQHALQVSTTSPYLQTPWQLTITSTLTDPTTQQKYGLGSSAATTVAIIKALHAFYFPHLPLDHATCMERSLSAHSQAQGNCGSGFDTAIATWGQPLHYTNTPEERTKPTLIQLPKELSILVGYSGSSAHTPTLIRHMMHHKNDNPLDYAHAINAINDLVTQIHTALCNNHNDELVHLINQNQTALDELAKIIKLTLTTPALNDMIQRARTYGVMTLKSYSEARQNAYLTD
ncbi:MAG: Phosphomevalonate kinase [candidate division TM6 bacterium GW2011_GWF2_38_10]|nr:MAG: Phosphomevalonate kinase [candidate division TM6 bacterium GW2011_GWF2_38_10]